MGRIVAILACIGIVASLSVAAPILTISANRDNQTADWNNRGSNSNSGIAAIYPAGNTGQYYCDWSAADLTALWAQLQTPPPAGQVYEVKINVTAREYSSSSEAGVNVGMRTFQYSVDWAELTADDHRPTGSGSNYGAYGVITSLPGVSNTGLIVDWVGPSLVVPGVFVVNSAVLDLAVVDDLCNNALARGILFYPTGASVTKQISTKEQWGGAKITVDLIPEPASLTLLGLGALGALIRRRR